MDRHRRTAIRAFALLLACSLQAACLGIASADYFGRNKVQYRHFKFQVLKTEHFDVYYYDEERAVAEQAARMAERWYERLSRMLDHQLSSRQPLILYASHPDFEQTNVLSGELGEGTGGVTEFAKRRIVMPVAGPLAETDHVIGHELVHAFQYDLARESRSQSGEAGLARLPLWFIEGMAEYLSLGARDANTAMWIRDAVQINRVPSVHKLSDPRFFPYRYGQAFWAYITARYGDQAVADCFKAANHASGVEQALERGLGVSADSLSAEWQRAIRAWDTPIAAATQSADHFGRRLIRGEPNQASVNVAPSVSPDGTRMMFLSERSLFSIDLYLADARTGKVIRKIIDTAVDPHFQSLQFIQSAGAWSPDGARFAFAEVTSGRPGITVIDSRSGRRLNEMKFKDLGEVFSPSWSPEGRRLVFSAIVGGATDLFVVDVQSGERRRLTDDLYADLHPAWSPDGSTIAFVTDRAGTNLDSLSYGREQLALIDAETGAIRELPTFHDGQSVNPQWSPDGRSVFFISTHNGIPNVYRTGVAGGDIRQVTDLHTGVSGITPLSPAISVARTQGTLVYSVFENGSYGLYTAETPELLAGQSPSPPIAGVEPDLLPPSGREPTEVDRLAHRASEGLAHASGFTRKPYRPGLSLLDISQSGVGVGAGTSGVALSGGTTLYFSDLLGDHNLTTLIQASNQGGSLVNNVAAVVAYDNRKSRWNWGLTGAQVPYLNQAFTTEEVIVSGEPLLVQREYRDWQIDRQIGMTLAYPFSRVSRFELSVGYRDVDFAGEVETSVFSEITGQQLVQQTDPLASDSIPSLHLMSSAAAFVYDASVFGGTSPVRGSRYRLEVDPVAGSLHYVGALADARIYRMPVRPLTIAARVIHVGRYSRDAEDPRLNQLYVGDGWLIHGYDSGSFTPAETRDFDRLLGSRMAVGNIEARLPLLGGLGLLRSPGIPPLEVAAFYDAGVAWSSFDKASFLGGSRDPVTSYGGAFRLNLLGFAVAELAYVHPNHRPLKSWYWQFNLQPGF